MATSTAHSAPKRAKTPRKRAGDAARAGATLTEAAARACLIAKDAAANLREFLTTSSRMAFITVQECERELDQIEREIDETLPAAITRVGEARARELLASLRFITDLERIGDLLSWVANRSAMGRLDQSDITRIAAMLSTLEAMLDKSHQGFTTRNRDCADEVLRMDPELDRQRTMIFEQHLSGRRKRTKNESVDALFITQAIERAGDHATNLAEEIIHLVEGRSMRHTKGRAVEA